MKLRSYLFTLLSLSFITVSSCKEPETVVTPDISIPESVIFQEGNTQQVIAIIPVTLSVASSQQVSCTWSTSDGIAVAGEDYTAVENSVLVFAPGETTKNIEVLISNDLNYEPDETFFIAISNIKNAVVKGNMTTVTIANDDAFNPVVTMDSPPKIAEGTATPVMAKVVVKLTPASDKAVTVKWSTQAGTARSVDDFVAVSGASLVFAPGETQKNIEIQIVNDNYLELDESFYIVVNEVTNATYTASETKVTLTNDDSYTCELASDGYITPATYPSMVNVWSDEFDGSALNLNWWTYETGAGGWGNNELQTYANSPNNSNVSDGKLKIIAIKENGNYTSARLITKGKKEFTYGRIDIRAKLPYGQGIWPALWMLGGNISQVSWPKCGEIDIMENLGQNVNKVYGTAHYDNGGHLSAGGSYSLSGQGFNDKFHVFTIMWQENSIRWYVDYNPYFDVTDSSIKFDAFKLSQFFIFNVAVGGQWPGNPDATTVFPQTMTVDYIRVFQP
ncbi:MAG: family 16 glycosylhydrolase [Bacteroidota bacterium]